MKPALIALLAPMICLGSAVEFDPLTPPLGLKTYRDLGITVDETTLAREWRDAGGKVLKSLAPGGWVFPLFDKGNQVRFTVKDSRSLWCDYSKDEGRTWSEPRFVMRLTDGATIDEIGFRKASGKTLRLTITRSAGKPCEVWFREDDLCRLAIASDIERAPTGRMVITSVPPENQDRELLADTLCVGRDIAFPSAQSPKGYKVSGELGLLVHESMSGQVVHRGQSKAGTLYESRALVTPKGDYLLMIPDGQHANAPRTNANEFAAYRSSDQGKSWQGPFEPFAEKTKHHAVLPLIPKGSKRIYLFETQRDAVAKPAKSERAFGFRFSEDDGRTWSPVELIRLGKGTFFGGAGVIQMTESNAGTWMVGFHHAKVLRGALEDGQRRWTLTSPEPSKNIYFMDELRAFALDGPNVRAFARTCEGHLWEFRSSDDGRTWAPPQPTTLAQPDAPPMFFTLSDGRTIIALHHNRAVLRSVHEPVHSEWLTMPTPTVEEVAFRNKHPHSLKDWVSRAEVWFSLSQDRGESWSEPRLLLANALAETLDSANPNYQCSYIDLFVDRGRVHLFIPHRWQRLVHLSFPEDQLASFQTREELRRNLPKP